MCLPPFQYLTHTQNVDPTAEIRPYNSCVTLKDTEQSVTSMCACCVCVLPDVKCALLCGAEWCGAGTDTAGHHLFPQVMDLRLETTVLYTQTHKHKHCYDQADFGWQVLKMKLKQTIDISNISTIYKPLCFNHLCSMAWKPQHMRSKHSEKYFLHFSEIILAKIL